MANNKAPKQRQITVKRSTDDGAKPFIYVSHKTLDEVAFRLQSLGGFKLYIYLLKHKPNTTFNLFSSDFMKWSGLSRTAYTTAFDELEREGYLVKKEGTETIYTFFTKSQIEEDPVSIEFAEEPQEEIGEGFVF